MTRRLVLRALAGIALFVAAGGTPVIDTIEAASDHSRARDADTIVVAGLPVRLKGVAAPEGRPAASTGAEHFGRLLRASKRVRCDLTAERTYDRRVGRCSFDGEDIQRALIADGYALPCLRYGGLRYVPAWVMAPRRGLPLPGYC